MTDQLLSQEERRLLELLAESDLPDSQIRRARLLLLLEDGVPTKEAATAVGISPGRARHWRGLFRSQGMGIFPAESLEAAAQPEDAASPNVEAASESESVVIDEPSKKQKVSPMDEFMSTAAELSGPGVEPDDPLAEAGRKVLRYHFAQMLLHEEGTRLGEDIEELHDMRVATRRMRAAFEVFGDAFTQKAVNTHLKGLKATGRSLGRVRDLDVFMEKAQHYLDTLPEDHQADLAPLLESWKIERETDRQQMVAYLDSDKYAAFKDAFLKFVTTPGEGARQEQAGGFAPRRARDTAPILIYERLASVRAFDSILENAALEQFHALRIEFKKLRYTVEYFREVLGAESKAVINDLKAIQDHLGDLNDADVATKILDDFLSVWDEQQNRLPVAQRQSPEPVLAYMIYRYNERQRLMQTFHTTWAHFNRQEFQQNLALAVSAL
jgi:CHAD domain-containing protein/transposase-like protein